MDIIQNIINFLKKLCSVIFGVFFFCFLMKGCRLIKIIFFKSNDILMWFELVNWNDKGVSSTIRLLGESQTHYKVLFSWK